MKIFARICGAISLVAWTILCISAATGYMTIDPIDYCLATGLLAFGSFVTVLRGF